MEGSKSTTIFGLVPQPAIETMFKMTLLLNMNLLSVGYSDDRICGATANCPLQWTPADSDAGRKTAVPED